MPQLKIAIMLKWQILGDDILIPLKCEPNVAGLTHTHIPSKQYAETKMSSFLIIILSPL